MRRNYIRDSRLAGAVCEVMILNHQVYYYDLWDSEWRSTKGGVNPRRVYHEVAGEEHLPEVLS